MKKILSQLMSFIETKEHCIVLTLVSLVILGGIFYSFYLGDNLRFSDEDEYYILAKNLSSKKMYTFDGEHSTAYRPPGYPLFLSFFISLGATITHLRILNFVALGFSIYLLYLIIKNQSSQFAGLLAALLVMCYPVLIYLAGILTAQTIGTTLFLLILFILSREKMFTIKPFLFAGFLFGYLILMIPSFIFSLLVVFLWVLFSNPERKVRASFPILFTALLVVSFWSVRNYTVFNSFVFISTHSGMILLDGNSEGTTPNAGSKPDTSKYTANMPKNLNEVERDRYLRSKAIEYMLNNKMRTIKMYFLKALNYFNYHNELRGDVETFTNKYKDIIMLLTYGPLILLFILRMLYSKQFKPSKLELLFIILYLSNPFFFGIFLTRIRYRLPFDFLMIAVVAMFIYNFIKTRERISS